MRRIYGAGFIKRGKNHPVSLCSHHQWRADEMQSRADLGLPFWDNRGSSRGTALGCSTGCLLYFSAKTLSAVAVQRLYARRIRRDSGGCPSPLGVLHPVCLLHPAPQTVRLLDCQTESGDAERDFLLFCPLRQLTPSWLAQPPGCNSPATSQSASVPSWHAPSATAKRYQAVSLLEERGLKSQVDPMRPPSPHRPGPQQLHQLRLGRQRMSHEAIEAHPPASAQSPDAPRQQQWDQEVAAHSAFTTGRARAEREHCRC